MHADSRVCYLQIVSACVCVCVCVCVHAVGVLQNISTPSELHRRSVCHRQER